MNRGLRFLLFFFPFLLLFGCQSTDQHPQKTLTAFSEALKQKDFEKARQLSTPESSNTIDMLKNGINSAEDAAVWLPLLANDFELKETKINGDKAAVIMYSKIRKEDFEIELIKINENWKVNFEISSLFKLMLKKLNRKGKEKAITLDQTLTELNQIDIKRVETELDVSKQKLDSVKNNFKKKKVSSDK